MTVLPSDPPRFSPSPVMKRLVAQGRLPALLTERELLVMSRLAEGKSYEEIGAELGVGRAAVSNTLTRCRDKLQSRNSVQAAVKLARAGLI